jgi:hypothetical protein
MKCPTPFRENEILKPCNFLIKDRHPSNDKQSKIRTGKSGPRAGKKKQGESMKM